MAAASAMPPETGLTLVELVWIEHRIQHWIRFGAVAFDQVQDRRRRIVGFAPGAVFAYVRWSANARGTVVSHLAIVQAVVPGAAYSTLPGVRPGGQLLARLAGWPRVRQALAVIDAVEAAGLAAADVAPDYWRHVHHQILARLPVRPYGADRHRAWRLRAEFAG